MKTKDIIPPADYSKDITLSGNSLYEGFKITRRHLPHWKADGAIYFITFDTHNFIVLNHEEQNIVYQHILEGNTKFYNLFTFVVMPDHVHIILRPLKEYDLSRVMQGIKGYSARKINLYRNSRSSIPSCPKKRENNVWLHESYDRIIRNDEELINEINYIMNNPIKKGLVNKIEEYQFWYLNENM